MVWILNFLSSTITILLTYNIVHRTLWFRIRLFRTGNFQDPVISSALNIWKRLAHSFFFVPPFRGISIFAIHKSNMKFCLRLWLWRTTYEFFFFELLHNNFMISYLRWQKCVFFTILFHTEFALISSIRFGIILVLKIASEFWRQRIIFAFLHSYGHILHSLIHTSRPAIIIIII